MAKYKLSGNGVKDNETGACIPNSNGNRHWKQYQEWLDLGNTPDPEFTQDELDALAVAEQAATDNKTIAKAARKLAIQQAKADGSLPPDWADPEDAQGENEDEDPLPSNKDFKVRGIN